MLAIVSPFCKCRGGGGVTTSGAGRITSARVALCAYIKRHNLIYNDKGFTGKRLQCKGFLQNIFIFHSCFR